MSRHGGIKILREFLVLPGPIDSGVSEDGNMAITDGDPPTVRYLWQADVLTF